MNYNRGTMSLPQNIHFHIRFLWCAKTSPKTNDTVLVNIELLLCPLRNSFSNLLKQTVMLMSIMHISSKETQ